VIFRKFPWEQIYVIHCLGKTFGHRATETLSTQRKHFDEKFSDLCTAIAQNLRGLQQMICKQKCSVSDIHPAKAQSRQVSEGER
jgi:hypothetical protein